MRKLLHGAIVMKCMGLPLSFIGNPGDDEERNTPNFKLNITDSRKYITIVVACVYYLHT